MFKRNIARINSVYNCHKWRHQVNEAYGDARTYLYVAREENAEEDVDKNEEDDEAERDEEQLHGDTATHTTVCRRHKYKAWVDILKCVFYQDVRWM